VNILHWLSQQYAATWMKTRFHRSLIFLGVLASSTQLYQFGYSTWLSIHVHQQFYYLYNAKLNIYDVIHNINTIYMPSNCPGGGLPYIEGRGCSSYLLGVKIKGLVSFRVSKYININLSNNISSKSIKNYNI